MFEILKKALIDYAGDGWYIIFALICIIIMRKDKNIKNYYARPIIALVFILFNPIFLYYIETYWIKGSRISKIYFAIPVFLCISYIISKHTKKWYFYLLSVVILVTTGTNIFNEKNFSAPTNFYKINDTVIEICNYINSMEENSKQNIKLLADISLVCQIRQYNPRFTLEFGRNPGQRSTSKYAHIIYDELYINDNTDPEIIGNCASADNCKYIIIFQKEMNICKYQYLMNIDNYYIYILK